MQLAIIDQQGQTTPLGSLATSAQVREVQELARQLMRDCEKLLDQMNPKKPGSGVPYR